MKPRAFLISATLLLAACGGAPTASHSGASSGPSAAVSPTGGPSVLLVVWTRLPTSDQPGSLSLFHEDGSPAGDLRLEAGSRILAIAGERIFVLTADGKLEALHQDGSVEMLGSDATAPTGIGGLAASSDGRRWVFGSQARDFSSQAIYVAGEGSALTKVATFPYPTVLFVMAWTSRGVFLDGLPADVHSYHPFDTPFGISGSVPFGVGGVRQLDPDSGTITTVSTPQHYTFADEATDGSIACIPTATAQLASKNHALRIISSSGHVADISLAGPTFNYVGDAFFSPDGSVLTVAGATGVGNNLLAFGGSSNPKPEEYTTDLIKTADGSISSFGPTGVRPAMGRQSWLPDGRLVLWRPDDVGGSPGLYIVDPHGDGNAPEIVTTGAPVGYLTG